MVVEIEGVPLHLAHPDELNVTWVGQEEVMRQLLAAWLVVDAQDIPMNPRLLGNPGVGKPTLAYHAAKRQRGEVDLRYATAGLRRHQKARGGRLHQAGHRGCASRGSSGNAGGRRRIEAALRGVIAG